MRTPKCAPKSALLTTGSNNCADVEDIDLRLRRTISDHELQNTIFNVIHCILIFQCLSGHASVHIPVHVSHLLHAYIYTRVYIDVVGVYVCLCIIEYIIHAIPCLVLNHIKSIFLLVNVFPCSTNHWYTTVVHHPLPVASTSHPMPAVLQWHPGCAERWWHRPAESKPSVRPCLPRAMWQDEGGCCYVLMYISCPNFGEGWGRMGKGRRMQEDGITIKK